MNDKKLQHGADIHFRGKNGFTSLMYHAKEGNLPKLRRQIERGADIHGRDDYDRTALILACTFGQIECVRCLIDHGADVQAVDCSGGTALWEAIVHSYWNSKAGGVVELIELLLAHGADVNTRNRHGVTPYGAVKCGEIYASLQEKEAVANLLAEAGAIE
jgi:ankyrin repeat protein